MSQPMGTSLPFGRGADLANGGKPAALPGRSRDARDLRRALARQLAAEYSVPFPVAFAAVRIGAERCLALAAELAGGPAEAFTAAVERLSLTALTLDMDRRPLTFRLHQVVTSTAATRGPQEVSS